MARLTCATHDYLCVMVVHEAGVAAWSRRCSRQEDPGLNKH